MSPRPDYDDSITSGSIVACPSCGAELASELPAELRHDVDGAHIMTYDSNLNTISTG